MRKGDRHDPYLARREDRSRNGYERRTQDHSYRRQDREDYEYQRRQPAVNEDQGELDTADIAGTDIRLMNYSYVNTSSSKDRKTRYEINALDENETQDNINEFRNFQKFKKYNAKMQDNQVVNTGRQPTEARGGVQNSSTSNHRHPNVFCGLRAPQLVISTN